MPTHYGMEGFMNTLITDNEFEINLSPCNITWSTDADNRVRPELGKDIIPEVDRIIFHDPATIVFWTDGTKTVVKCMEGQKFSEYYGFLAALAKKIYGTNSAVERIVRQYSAEAKA